MAGPTDDPEDIGVEQAVINAFVEKLRELPLFEGFSFYIIPTYDPNTFTPPWVHVFFSVNNPSQEAHGNRYKYDGQVRILIVIPQHELQSDHRQIYKLSEEVDNMFIRNKQMLVRSDIRSKQYTVTSKNFEYEPEILEMEGIDTVEMIIATQYGRTVDL